jgi:hypothetical protein
MRVNLKYLLFFPLILFISVYIPFSYTNGDLYHYAKFWDSTVGVSLAEAIINQRIFISSNEILYGTTVWAFSNANLDRLLFLSFFNFLLLHFFVKFLIKHQVSTLNIFLLSMSWYIFILVGPAERLKFAYLFIFAFFYSGNRILFFLSILFHFSSLFTLYAYSLMKFRIGDIKKYIFNFKFYILLMPVLATGAYIFPFLLTKIPAIPLFTFDFLPSIILLLFIGLFSKQSIFQVLVLILLLLPFFLYLGGTRLNMIILFVFIYFMVIDGKSNNIVFYLVNIYNFIKGIFFLYLVGLYGTAFP